MTEKQNPSYRNEKIVCPNCDSIQDAIVGLGHPWDTYYHHCLSCEYIIMESEWDPLSEWTPVEVKAA